MPRKARIDAPGAVQHIIIRGIERKNIFRDTIDKDTFIPGFGKVVNQTSTPRYAWVLMDNHAHLLLRTGRVPIATLMRKLLKKIVIVLKFFSENSQSLQPRITIC